MLSQTHNHVCNILKPQLCTCIYIYTEVRERDGTRVREKCTQRERERVEEGGGVVRVMTEVVLGNYEVAETQAREVVNRVDGVGAVR